MNPMQPTRCRLRLRFTKGGDQRWISHRDLARLWERLLRRAELELVFSQGFHPKPKISFPSALALGIEALDEVVELEVVGQPELSEIQDRIAAQLPPGMELLSVERVAGKARWVGSTYQLDLPPESVAPTQGKIAQLRQRGTIQVDRDGQRVECSTEAEFFDICLQGKTLVFSLPATERGASLRPSELLEMLDLKCLLDQGVPLRRTQLHLSDQQPVPGG